MAQALDTFGILHQNLIDAGCDQKTVEQCMALAREKRQADMLLVLSKYRSELLKMVRSEQQKIDCLDFLIYSLQKDLKVSGL